MASWKADPAATPFNLAAHEHFLEYPLDRVVRLHVTDKINVLGPDHELGSHSGLDSVPGARPDHSTVCGLEDCLFAASLGYGGRQRIGFAEEVGGKDRGGPEVELGGSTDLLDARIVHETDTIGHHHCFLLIVSHVQYGDAEILVQMLDLALQRVAKFLVERAERLVHQDDGRLVDGAACKSDTLLLSA